MGNGDSVQFPRRTGSQVGTAAVLIRSTFLEKSHGELDSEEHTVARI